MIEPEWNCDTHEEDAYTLGLKDNPELSALIIQIRKLKKDYDVLQERFQKLWFENHSVKELNVSLQDKIEELESRLDYEQDYK